MTAKYDKAIPQKTYALVVGIEKYSGLESQSLDGPVKDAVRFVNWLEERGVPKTNIFLCLAPLEKNKHLLPQDSKEQGATEKTIKKVIRQEILENNILKEESSLLFCFWGGHGIIVDRDRMLYCEDSAEEDMLINYTSLLRRIRYDDRLKNLISVFFLDACGHNRNFIQNSYNFNNYHGYSNEGIINTQYVVYSTKENQSAWNQKGEGVFSGVLLELLDADKSFPPNLKKIQKEIQTKFITEKQTPEFEGNWDDDDWPEDKEEKFVEAILKLNYDHQLKILNLFKRDKKNGAFLIYGKNNTGQNYLLNILVKKYDTDKIVKFELTHNTLSSLSSQSQKINLIESIWVTFFKKFGIEEYNTNKFKFYIKKAKKVLRNKDIVLIIKSIDIVLPRFLEKLLDEFWKPLVKSLGMTKNRLIMFVVYSTNYMTMERIEYTEEIDEYEPHMLMKFKEVTGISIELVNHFFEYNIINKTPLPERFRGKEKLLESMYNINTNSDLDPEEMLELERCLKNTYDTKTSSDIDPEEMLKKICCVLQYDWEQKRELWLPH